MANVALVRTLAVVSVTLAALVALTACGSSQPTSQSALRIFDPTGRVQTEVTLAGFKRSQIGVSAAQPHIANLYLPLTRSGEANFCRLGRALAHRGARAHNHREKYALELNGHVYSRPSILYSVDYANGPSPTCGPPDSLWLLMDNMTAGKLARLLRVADITNVQVGAERAFYTPKPGRHGALCEIDVAMPALPTSAYCVVVPARDEGKNVGATLVPSGHLGTCPGLTCIGDDAEGALTPTLRDGKPASLGPFRCTALRFGVRCVVTETGRGFLLTAGHVKQL